GQGIAEAARRQFDLAIVDLRLPDLDGRNVAAQIRSVEAPPHVVLATGLAVEVGDVTLKALADDVLPKPWQADELQAMLERVRRHVRERMPGHP
ncbi:MAG: response regulator, partial [Betaproteobacteria bacterium]|nr:response regulator [Betaproteobacteria bacterium]